MKPTDLLLDTLCIQTSEECGELIQALLKLTRTTSENPTPKSFNECMENVLEEMADVELCLQILRYKLLLSEYYSHDDEERRIKEKLCRWEKRLSKKCE